ncbi:MAG: DUF547 domain-containing protein [Bacteroidota bacterium]|nr:DUF547 domain-containing protein [Bacteroidota bacterium]
MYKFIYRSILLSAVLFCAGCNNKEVRITDSSKSIHYNFSEMDSFFKKYVSEGKVNYLKVKDDKALDKIINDVKSIEPYLIEDGNERLSFWINAYNIYTIKLITQYYPLNSITDIRDITGTDPWSIEFIEMAGGRKFSLDEIEKKIIIPKYKDPRVHYALVCAAESCPVIIPEAYLPEKLDVQLNRQAKIFLNDKKKNYLVKEDNELNLSRIYRWYGKDFINKDSSVINHVIQYLNNNDKNFIVENGTDDISYLEYSWELNDFKEK